ncbi:LytTR family DNA-binding domain-containing protein [Ruegeria sp.]|uniref:LytTR family DNA-binding domain-containing protein n=1 Tax=Ruegeria sp. TaxID=1879320 RepID=UPI003C7A40C5
MSGLRPLLTHFSLQRTLAGVIFIPLLAYCFDPFRDMNLSFLARLIFWSGVIALALAVTWGARQLVRRNIRHSTVIMRDMAFAAFVLCLFAPALWVLSWLVFTFSGQETPGPTAVMPYGFMLAAGLMFVHKRDEATPEEPAQTPRLFRRLPQDFDGTVFRLTVRDHYVDVVTSVGVFTIRSRLTDAISEMEPVLGFCTHRSHWVTEAAIAGIEKQGNRTFLKLCNGDLIPISRKYRSELEQAGLV